LGGCVIYAAAMLFFGSKKGRSTTVASHGPLCVITDTELPNTAWLISTIAKAMFCFNRGEYTADVTRPMTTPSL
jgi:hypothetical protein